MLSISAKPAGLNALLSHPSKSSQKFYVFWVELDEKIVFSMLESWVLYPAGWNPGFCIQQVGILGLGSVSSRVEYWILYSAGWNPGFYIQHVGILGSVFSKLEPWLYIQQVGILGLGSVFSRLESWVLYSAGWNLGSIFSRLESWALYLAGWNPEFCIQQVGILGSVFSK